MMDMDDFKFAICKMNVHDFIHAVKAFHQHIAPGVVLGGLMVDLGMELMEKETEFDVVCETQRCLPDAVQLLTPCTIGNGWLKIVNWDKFALTFYNPHSRKGRRIWVDVEKTQAFPDVFNWFMKKTDKNKLPLNRLINSILEAHRNTLSHGRVHLHSHYKRKKKGDIYICPRCKEAYPLAHGNTCLTCRDKPYFKIIK